MHFTVRVKYKSMVSLYYCKNKQTDEHVLVRLQGLDLKGSLGNPFTIKWQNPSPRARRTFKERQGQQEGRAIAATAAADEGEELC